MPPGTGAKSLGCRGAAWFRIRTQIMRRRRSRRMRSPTAVCARLFRWLRRRSAEVGWRAAVDSLRPHTQSLWQSLDQQEQLRFLRHARAWWDVRRSRIAPEVASTIARLIGEGRLEIIAGRAISARDTGEALEVDIRRRGARFCPDDALRHCVQLHWPAARDRPHQRSFAAQFDRCRAGSSRSSRNCPSGGRAFARLGRGTYMGARASNARLLLGNHRRSRYSRAGRGGRRGYCAGD